ncbi:MAG: hypothetical protein HGA66_05345 [Holophaga sp.]|nr:hypothetical protein [Holophaga sp.]
MPVPRTAKRIESGRLPWFQFRDPGRWRLGRDRHRRRLLWTVDFQKACPALWRHGTAAEEARAQARTAAKAAARRPRRFQN